MSGFKGTMESEWLFGQEVRLFGNFMRNWEGEVEDAKWLPDTARAHAQKMLKVIRWGLEKFPDNKDQNNEGSQQNAN